MPMKKLIAILVLVTLAFGAKSQIITASTNAISASWHTTANYIYSVFRYPAGCSDPACENLFILSSPNSSGPWTLVQSCYIPPSGHNVRDPSATKIGSTWWLVYTAVTDGAFATGPAFDLAYSSDGVCYTFLQSVDTTSIVGNGANAATWAPEWFIDSDFSVHVFFSGSTNSVSSPFSVYELHPTTTLTPGVVPTWSSITGITGTSLPANYYDPYVIKIGSTYNLFYTKNDANHYVEYMSSASLTSGYTVTGSGDWAGWGMGWEGACVIALASGGYHISFDHSLVSAGLYSSFSAGNLTGPWAAPSLMTVPFVSQHGTILSLH
jgi:hypothetical protein